MQFVRSNIVGITLPQRHEFHLIASGGVEHLRSIVRTQKKQKLQTFRITWTEACLMFSMRTSVLYSRTMVDLAGRFFPALAATSPHWGNILGIND